jgi:hypothetical protein
MCLQDEMECRDSEDQLKAIEMEFNSTNHFRVDSDWECLKAEMELDQQARLLETITAKIGNMLSGEIQHAKEWQKELEDEIAEELHAAKAVEEAEFWLETALAYEEATAAYVESTTSLQKEAEEFLKESSRFMAQGNRLTDTKPRAIRQKYPKSPRYRDFSSEDACTCTEEVDGVETDESESETVEVLPVLLGRERSFALHEQSEKTSKKI